MKIKTFGALGSGAVVALGAIAKLKPETFYGTDFSFIEYLLSIVANPLMFIAIASTITIIILSTKFGKAGVAEILRWKEKDTTEVYAKVRPIGFLPLIAAFGALSWLSYETYALTRNSTSFLRDRFGRQYQVDAFSRCRLEEAKGHLTLAKACFVSFSKTFEGHPLSESASRDIKRIDKQMELKNALLHKARASERTFGPTPLSVHLKIEALWLHPWDSELRREIQDEVDNRFNKGLTKLLQDREACAAGTTHLQAAREDFGLLGYMRDVEVGSISVTVQALGERLCAMVSPLSPDQLTARVISIWQRPRVDAILAATDPARLEQNLQSAITELRYPALKEQVLNGHRNRDSVLTEQEAIEEEQQQLNPAFPDVMIPPPKTKHQNGAIISTGRGSVDLGSPPQNTGSTNDKEVSLPPIPVVPELTIPPAPPRIVKGLSRSY